MKTMKWLFSFAVLFGAVVFLASCASAVDAKDDTYLTIDINPSVELLVNKREKVVLANPLNEDAEILLSEIDLIGMSLEDAMDLIIQTALELGYINIEDDQSEYIYVSSISNNNELGEKIRTRAKEHINKAFQDRAMMGRAEDKGFTPEFLEEATSYGVTPGFLFLAQKAVEASDELLLEDALQMEVWELQAILKEARAQHKEVAHALRQQFFEDRQAIFDVYMPQIQEVKDAIEALEVTLAEKEALLVDATEEDQITIQAEIDAIKLEIGELEAELLALIEAMHAEIDPLREQFHADSEALRLQAKEMFQNKKQQFEESVNQFLQNKEQRREQQKDAIDNFQKNRP